LNRADLDVTSSFLSIFGGTSNETSNFIVDRPEQWWEANQRRREEAARVHRLPAAVVERVQELSDGRLLEIRPAAIGL
jgi:hypothetical protein